MLKWIGKKRNQKGFTLIELVVVIAILGILMALAAPRLIGFTGQAKAAADKQAAATIAKAVQLYRASNNITNTDVPTPKVLFDNDMIEAKALVPQYKSATNLGYNVVADDNGVVTVKYATTAAGSAATAWGTATGDALYPAP